MFHAYTNALELIRALVPVVEQLKTYDSNLADQVTRAATSITLNVSEGSKRAGRDRRRFYVMAQGSAGEIRGALDTADAWGWRVDSARARALVDRELALLWACVTNASFARRDELRPRARAANRSRCDGEKSGASASWKGVSLVRLDSTLTTRICLRGGCVRSTAEATEERFIFEMLRDRDCSSLRVGVARDACVEA